jgi:CheY-like chemotaxis protein
MSNRPFPFAVRAIGFSGSELADFDKAFDTDHGKGYGYFRLEDDNLQDPDLYIANAEDLRALITLQDLRPSEIRPALLIGTPKVTLPYVCLPRPLRWQELFTALDALVEKRADALSRLEASDVVIVPERRRGLRLDFDLTDPAAYEKMRAKIHENGAVLVVDKSPAMRNYLTELLARKKTPVAWVEDEVSAVAFCKQHPTSMVLINTSVSELDPYRLCWAIKEKDAPAKTVVIFLISKPFEYDPKQARYVGVEGFVNKPLSRQGLLAIFKKFLPSSI